ncbi:unnamed protein product [Zymoseptoria tritici ST99CH_1E4]|uniref:Uncharacterized protein n=1 Tax=Zymoseptoria tritici ST99CH_1E4 TaxID=1276532 RepID=A0A2H1FKW8_ZYMTR|nr:unnamed protein product [Zymoseptoria tritici ST99CH_1E4]
MQLFYLSIMLPMICAEVTEFNGHCRKGAGKLGTGLCDIYMNGQLTSWECDPGLACDVHPYECELDQGIYPYAECDNGDRRKKVTT